MRDPSLPADASSCNERDLITACTHRHQHVSCSLLSHVPSPPLHPLLEPSDLPSPLTPHETMGHITDNLLEVPTLCAALLEPVSLDILANFTRILTTPEDAYESEKGLLFTIPAVLLDDRVTKSLSTNRVTSQEAEIEAKDTLTEDNCITKGTDEITTTTTTGTTSPLRSILSKTPKTHSQCAVSKRDKPTLASSGYRFDADHDGAISLNPDDEQQPTPVGGDQRRIKLTWGTKVTRLFRRGDVCSPWNAPDLTQAPKEDLSYLEVPTKAERMEARVKRYYFKKKICAKGPIHRPPANGYSDESEGENESSETTVGHRVRRVIHSASTQDWAQGDESDDDEAAVPLALKRPKRRMSDSHCENMAATKKARVGEHGTLILRGLQPT
ncbi:MAG: hypothetical protein J3Q66DRAFT_7288 [Benniella sp.]|nr:MAG: hypothetical protein J3Q66DRAFT_7288 [Benniella sp.]